MEEKRQVEHPGANRAGLVAFAARVGSIALVSGASASEATEMLVRLGLAHGVRLDADVTYTGVTVSVPSVHDGRPLTVVRFVPGLDRDYDRLAHLEGVVDGVVSHELTLEQATRELERRRGRGSPYGRPVRWPAAFLQGVAVCTMLGGQWLEALLAGVATFLVELAAGYLGRRGASYFVVQVAAGAIPMFIGLAVMYWRNHGLESLWTLSPALIVAAGMVAMLAGLGLVGAAQDALDAYFVTAGARIIEIIMRTTGIIVGVAGMLWLGSRLGIPAYLAPEAQVAPAVWVQLLCALTFSTAFAIGVRVSPRGLGWAAFFGAFGWAVTLGVRPLVGQDAVVAAGVTAAIIALAASVVAQRTHLPAIAFTTVGIAALMPGMLLYRGLYRLVTGIPGLEPGDASGPLFLLAILTGLALALGSSVGSIVGRQVVPPTEHLARRAASRVRRRSRAPRN